MGNLSGEPYNPDLETLWQPLYATCRVRIDSESYFLSEAYWHVELT